MSNIEYAGFVRDDSGTAIEGATVELMDRNGTTALESTTTNSSGYWAISRSPDNDNTDRGDIHITSGDSKRILTYDDAVQLTELDTANLHLRNPANTYTYDIVPAAITADRQLNLPLITGTKTLVATDTALADDADIEWGASSDVLLRWSTGDSSNHAFAIGLGSSNAAMHIANAGDIATDWNLSAEADPQVFVHSILLRLLTTYELVTILDQLLR